MVITVDFLVIAGSFFKIPLPLSSALTRRVKVGCGTCQLPFQEKNSYSLTLLAKDSSPDALPRSLVGPRDNSVYDTAVIPHGNAANIPLPPDVVVVSRVNVVGEEVQQLV
jgi:hypothetical protein